MKAILAMSKNRCIGKNGILPWNYKDDLKWFKEFTLNKKIVIGLNTYKTLPVLDNRTIYVLSKSLNSPIQFLFDKSTIYYFISNIDFIPDDAIICGGKVLYESLIDKIDEFYVTHIDKDYDGDTFMFPFEHYFKHNKIIKEFDFGNITCYYK